MMRVCRFLSLCIQIYIFSMPVSLGLIYCQYRRLCICVCFFVCTFDVSVPVPVSIVPCVCVSASRTLPVYGCCLCESASHVRLALRPFSLQAKHRVQYST